MKGSPYRTPARAELVVGAKPTVTAVVWAVWGATVAFVAILFLLDEVWSVRAAVAALVVGVATSLVLLRRAARRVQWRFVLERDKLQLERVAPAATDIMGMLDVSGGVRIKTDFSSQTDLDLTVTIKSRGERIHWEPGTGAQRAVARLSKFLADHDVVVRERNAVRKA